MRWPYSGLADSTHTERVHVIHYSILPRPNWFAYNLAHLQWRTENRLRVHVLISNPLQFIFITRDPRRSSTACRPKSCYRFNQLWKTIFFSIMLPIRSSIFLPPQALEPEASLICLFIYRDSPSVNHCLPLSCHAEDRGYGQELFDEIPERGTISF